MHKSKVIDLTSLIEFASQQAEKIFNRTGQFLPMYHAIKADGQHMIMPALDNDKDVSVALTKVAFALNNVQSYVFIDEAWVLEVTKTGPPIDVDKARREGVRHHPDRREILMFSAENTKGEAQTAKRYILRSEVGKPRLSPLTFDPKFERSEGRMVGLLNWEKKA